MPLEGITPVGAPSPQGPRAQGVHWDLSVLYPSIASARAAAPRLLRQAKRFESRHRNTVATMTPRRLEQAMDEYAALVDQDQRLTNYAYLRLATDQTESAGLDLLNTAERVGIECANHIRFFELEFQELPEARAKALAASPQLARYRHHLEQLTAAAQHRLSEAEEHIVDELSPAVGAWQQLFAETLASVSVPFDDGSGSREHTIDELLAHLRDDRRPLRRAAIDALYTALAPCRDVLAKCYDSLVGNRLTMDRLTHYTNPMQEANVNNDLDDAVVTQLIDSVEAHYPLAQRWFRTKAALLGLPVLQLSDQYAPLGNKRTVPFAEGREMVRAAIERFSPELWAIIGDALDSQRIDAEPRPGKSGGAFCAGVAASAKPFLMMNYTDSLEDVDTLAHEAGHLIHFTLAGRAQTPLSYETGMAMAEVASTFNEMLIFDHVMQQETDPATRQAVVAERIDSCFATIFRQTMMARYEQLAYALKADEQSLTADRLSDFWIEQNQRYYGGTVELPDGYRLGWSYVSHFIDTRFYTYSYSFAQLAALCLYAKYREQGQPFVRRYIDFLQAGGAQSPQQLLGSMGIDITDPHWVDAGFGEIERMVQMASAPAAPGATA